MTPGTAITVVFEAAAFNELAAFQVTLRFDPEALRLDSPEGLPVLELSVDNFGVSEIEHGIIRMTWDAIDAQTLLAGTPVFQLNFTVLRGDTRLSEALHLDEKVMPAEAFNQDMQAAGIDMVFTESLGQHPDIAQQGPVLLENRPNPFTDRTIIRFMLPKSETATVSVFDAQGRKLWQQTQQYDEGYHELPVQLGQLPAAGFLYYELATPSGKWSRKMVRAVP